MPITGAQKALMVSRLNVLRLGAGRLDYYPPRFLLTINGTDRRAFTRIAGVSIRDYLDGTPNTATLRVDGFTPSKGHEIKMALGELDAAHYLFCGHILRTTQVYEADKPANVAWDLECISYEWLLNRRKVTKRYTSQSATSIATDLIASGTAGFTTVHVAAGLATIDEITFTNEEVTDALDRLAKRIGGYWYVDYAKDLHFFVTEDVAAHSIVDGTVHGARDIVSSTDLSQVRTRVLVEGGGSAASTDVAVGQTTFPVDDATWYNASGGTVAVGPQRIDYTGKDMGGAGGALVGSLAVPTTAPSLALATGTGLTPSSAYLYAVTFYDGTGETTPGPTAPITTGAAAPAAPSSIGAAQESGSTVGSLDASAAYGYKFTFWKTDDSGVESAPSAAATFTTGSTPEQRSGVLFKSGTSSPPAGHRRKFYRTEGGGGTYKAMPGALDGFEFETSDVWYETQADSALGATAPSAAVERQQVALSSLPLGPSGTTGRKLYRTVAGGSQLKLVTTIANNTATTYTDSTADGSLGANAPTTNTSALTNPSGTVNAGSTAIPVTGVGPFSSGGGWVLVAGQYVRYTGKGDTSLTGVPSSGIGAVQATVNYGTEILAAPSLSGIPASGVGSVLYAFNRGEPVNLVVTRNDATAQAAMAGFVGGDGIHEEYIQDNRLSETEANARGDAHLTLAKDPLITITYRTRDQTTRSGRTVTFNLAAPTSLSGTFKIQSVTISGLDAKEQTFPARHVEASSRRMSLEALLRAIKAA